MQHADTHQPDHQNAYLLGEWQVFPDTGLLIRAGFHIHAEPKVMSVLECLMQSGGRLVTRDELINKVWTHVVVNDEVLTRAISELRTLLGDVSRERRYIATVPKRGYKLLMPAQPISAPIYEISAPVSQADDTRNGSVSGKTSGSWWITLPGINRRLNQSAALMGYFLISSALIFSLWMNRVDLADQASATSERARLEHGQPPGTISTALQSELRRFQVSGALFEPGERVAEHMVQSVLITPLTVITDDEQTRAFAAGLTEDLQHAIFRLTDLQVVQQLTENNLENSLILSGSVRLYDQLSRVNLQLVDALTSRVLWSSAFECPVDAILGVQTQIAKQAGRHLQQSLNQTVMQS